MTACGLSYDGKDEKTGEHTFNRIRGIYTWQIITTNNMQTFARVWNHQTHEFLKQYVYLR